MTDLTAWELLGLIVTAAFSGGFGGQALLWIKEWTFERRREQLGRELRYEEAASRARDILIEDAGNVSAWIDYKWAETHGPEVDFYSELPKPSTGSVGEVLAALQRIATRHPMRGIRVEATELRHDIDAMYGDVTRRDDPRHVHSPFPSQDTFKEWSDAAEKLVEAIHEAAQPK